MNTTVFFLIFGLIGAPAAHSQTYTVLHTFIGGNDGAYPYGQLIIDNHDNLYGTTSQGGESLTWGTIFKLNSSGSMTVMHNFTSADGDESSGALIMDNYGNLYGATHSIASSGYGTIFKLNQLGVQTVLYKFTIRIAEGASPDDLLMDQQGNLYGATSYAGSFGYGTIFKLAPSGMMKVLHHFTNKEGWPLSLTTDGLDNLYGVTSFGGSYFSGIVFKVDTSGRMTVLHEFTGANGDGAYPIGHLVTDQRGNLYGVTCRGGSFNGGTVFKLDPAGAETLLHSFRGSPADGSFPELVTIDSSGILYGLTSSGGSFGGGTVFKLDTSGLETLLYSFSRIPGAQAQVPTALTLDEHGDLYGTTCCGGSYRFGTVFRLAPRDRSRQYH